jgi:hypothetical protein
VQTRPAAARLLGLAVLRARTVVRSTDALARVRDARPVPIAIGAVLYGLAFATRAARLNLLLPPEDRLPFGHAWSLSAAATFLLQVLPFRGGEVAGWALIKRALGASWARAGAVFLLVKVVDSTTLLVFGLGGAVLVAARSGARTMSGATGALLLVAAVGLALLPRPGAAFSRWLAARSREGSRLRRVAEEFGAGLEIASSRPAAYHAALVLSLAFFAGHLAMLHLVLAEGFGADVSPGALAFASLTSVMTSGIVPSPAGTFGPMESGFAAGLLLDGVPAALGAVLATAAHILATAVAGLVALPTFISGAGSHRPPVRD